ncbi:MAG: ArsR family transcriptional regulator [Methanoregula sp.]|jgi:predicted transcriptional regulator
MYLTEREEEFTNLLVEIGTRKNVAKVLVFLANIPEATSKDIGRGTDLRQPAISDAMRYLIGQSWITSRKSKAENKGRAVKIYELSRPFHKIIDCIEKKKKEEATNQIILVQKLQYHLR